MDKTLKEYVIRELDKMTHEETLKRLKHDKEFNELWMTYMLEFMNEHPEVKQTVMNMMRESFPDITKKLDAQGFVSSKEVANALSIDHEELTEMVEESPLLKKHTFDAKDN